MEGIFAPGGQAAGMSNSGIGIPQIEPRQRVTWQDAHRPPDRGGDKDGTGAGKHDRPPPEPGTGELVDKVV
jgi:hypothetical protein